MRSVGTREAPSERRRGVINISDVTAQQLILLLSFYLAETEAAEFPTILLLEKKHLSPNVALNNLAFMGGGGGQSPDTSDQMKAPIDP